MEKELLTAKEICKRLKVTRQALSQWVAKGCPYVTKNPYRYDFEEVVKWINEEK